MIKVPRVGMSIRDFFSNLIDLKVIDKYDKGAVMELSTVFGLVYHVALQRVL